MDTFSIGPVVVAQEVLWLTSFLATSVVSLIQFYFVVVCDRIHPDRFLVHDVNVMLLRTLVFFKTGEL